VCLHAPFKDEISAQWPGLEIARGELGRIGVAAGDVRARSAGGIRATVIGASQYTIQVSGSTIFLSPLAGIVPAQATAPALVLVGYLMFTLISDINVRDMEDGIPALLTMILMPLTYDITVGIGAGFISWVVIKVIKGKMGEVHLLMWVVALAFVIYFLKDWISLLIGK